MKVAVTGASGFVGRSLCAGLSTAGHEVIAVDLRHGNLSGIAAGEAVVHLAAIAHRRASEEDLRRVNVELARKVGEAAAASGASLVFLSSVKVHGEKSSVPFRETAALAPADLYGESKLRAEQALRAISGLRLAVLRPPLVYGPGVKANFLALMRALARGIPLPLASVQNRRSLIYVGNLVDAILRSLGKEGTFLVSDGAALSTPQLCRSLGEALERPARLWPFPTLLLPGKLTQSLELDDSAIRGALGWRPPFTCEEGLRATARWYRGR
jgi:nucleoside-diphosphate-sugar epimerase